MAASRRPIALLVDDDPISQKAARTQLEGRGYTVSSAQGQTEALSQARLARPDVIYVHLGSGGDNLRLIQALRSDDACRHIPIGVMRDGAGTPNTKLKSVPRGGW